MTPLMIIKLNSLSIPSQARSTALIGSLCDEFPMLHYPSDLNCRRSWLAGQHVENWFW
jgi:hypothetical protein